MLLGRLQKLSKARRASRARTSCSSASGSPTPPTARSAPTPGGMRRRLDLAACLVVHRPVVFLDEPTTGLDPASRADMWGAIEGLVDDGAALRADHPVPRGGRPAGRPDRRAAPAAGRSRPARPAELKARVGDRRVHLTLPDDDALAGRRAAVRAARARARRARPPPDRPGARTARATCAPRSTRSRTPASRSRRPSLSQPTLDDAFFALAGERAADAGGRTIARSRRSTRSGCSPGARCATSRASPRRRSAR